MRAGGRTRKRSPYIGEYLRRRGLTSAFNEVQRRVRSLELAPREGGIVNITRVTGAASIGGGGGGGGEDIQATLAIGDDAQGENLFDLGFLSLRDGGELTIAAGAITVTDSFHTVDTQADDATDDLDTINGGTEGQFLALRAADGARTVVVKHNIGNILVVGDADISLDDQHDWIWAIYDAELNVWIVQPGPGGGGGGSDNAVFSLPRAGFMPNAAGDDISWHFPCPLDCTLTNVEMRGKNPSAAEMKLEVECFNDADASQWTEETTIAANDRRMAEALSGSRDCDKGWYLTLNLNTGNNGDAEDWIVLIYGTYD